MAVMGDLMEEGLVVVVIKDTSLTVITMDIL